MRKSPASVRQEASALDGHAAPEASAARLGRLLGAEDVAEILGVRATFVYALVRRGELPAVRIGERYVRFRSHAIACWIEQRESTRPRGTQ